MDDQVQTETELEKKRRSGRERVQRFRDRQKAKEAADLSQVDCQTEITNAEARRILKEERGFRPIPGSNPMHVLDVATHLLKTAAESLGIPFNWYLVRYGVTKTLQALLQLMSPETEKRMIRLFLHGKTKAEVKALILGPPEDLLKTLQTCEELAHPEIAEIVMHLLHQGKSKTEVEQLLQGPPEILLKALGQDHPLT